MRKLSNLLMIGTLLSVFVGGCNPIKTSKAISISTSSHHTCALLENKQIVCWGKNDVGQLGSGTDENSNVPVYVKGINDALAISTGLDFSCAIVTGGKVVCWGLNDSGQLGYKKDPYSYIPVEVSGISDATAIAAGWDAVCAITEIGEVECWGY